MIDLNKLRESYKELTEKEAKKGGSNDSPFLKLALGANIIRILPPKEEGLPFYTQTRIHTIVGKDKSFKYLHCRKVHSEPCPMCDAYTQLWENHKKVCPLKNHKDCDVPYGKGKNSIKPRDRFYMNVVDRRVDEVKIASFPMQLFTKVMTAMLGNDELKLEPLGDITDLETGRDFNIVSVMKDDYQNYEQSAPRGVVTPAGVSKQRVAEYMDMCHDIKNEVKLEDYEEMQKTANTLLAQSTVGLSGSLVSEEASISGDEFKQRLKG